MSMSRYDDDPTQAEASVMETNDELSRLDDARVDAEARSDELEQAIDGSDDENERQRFAEELDRVEEDLEKINSDLDGAHQVHADNVKFWFD